MIIYGMAEQKGWDIIIGSAQQFTFDEMTKISSDQTTSARGGGEALEYRNCSPELVKVAAELLEKDFNLVEPLAP